MWYSSSSKLDKVMHSIDYTGPTLSSSCVHKRAGFIIFKLMMGSEMGPKKTTCERPPQLILAILGHEILQMLSEIRHLGLSRSDLFRFPHSPNRHNQNEAPLWCEMSEQCLAWRKQRPGNPPVIVGFFFFAEGCFGGFRLIQSQSCVCHIGWAHILITTA